MTTSHDKIWERVSTTFENAETLRDLWTSYLGELAHFGITEAMYGINVYPRPDKNAGLKLDNFDPAWIQAKKKAGVFYKDPFVRAIRRQSAPVLWSDTRILADVDDWARKSLAIDHEMNVLTGVSIPMTFGNGYGISAVGCHAPSMTWNEFERLWMNHGDEICFISNFFDRIAREKFRFDLFPLTPAEKECLRLIAQGHQAKHVAEIRGVYVSVANKQIRELQKRLDADRAAEAVMIANSMKLI